MKIYRLFSTFLAIIVLACLFGVQGQIQVAPSTTAPSAAQNPAQFSQYYTMTSGPAPSNPISAPQQFEIAGMPSTVYLGEQMQSVPYSQYQSSPADTGANSLWIKGATTWAQYAVVPQGATVSLFAISQTGGSGSLTYDGQIYSNNYVFYPSSLLTFYAGTIGQHTLSFAINGQASNQVVIDVVVGTYTQPSTNPENNPEYYPEYYPGDYCNAGYHIDEYGYCVPDQVQCNAGYHLENGICVPDQVQCGAGTHLENGTCVPDQVQCGTGTHLENGICVPDQVQCGTGYHLENDVCVPDQMHIPSITPVNPSINVPSINPVNPSITPVNPSITLVNPSITLVNPSINVPSINPVNPSITPVNPSITPVNPSITPVNPSITPVNPSITSVNPSINVPSIGDNNQCDTGYHLENDTCVPDQ